MKPTERISEIANTEPFPGWIAAICEFLDEQYTKQEEETVKEGCADCPHDATPTNTDKDTITCSNTPIVEECTPGNCPYSGGGTMGGGVMGWGGSPSFFQEMKARHDRYHQ